MPGGIPRETVYFEEETILQLMCHSELAVARTQWDKGNVYLKHPLRIPRFNLYLFESKSKKAHTHQIYPGKATLDTSLLVYQCSYPDLNEFGAVALRSN